MGDSKYLVINLSAAAKIFFVTYGAGQIAPNITRVGQM